MVLRSHRYGTRVQHRFVLYCFSASAFFCKLLPDPCFASCSLHIEESDNHLDHQESRDNNDNRDMDDKHSIATHAADEYHKQLRQSVIQAFMARKTQEFLDEERTRAESKMAAKRERDAQREATLRFCQEKQKECDTELINLSKEQSAEDIQEARMLQKIQRKRKRDVSRGYQMEFLKQQLDNISSKREKMEEARRDDEQQIMDLQDWMAHSDSRIADKVARCTMTMADLVKLEAES